MKTCITCGQILKKDSFKVKSVSFYECRSCKLAIPSKLLQVENLPYSFAEYDSNKVKYEKRFLKLIKYIQSIKKKGSVLEVGSGFGLFAYLISKNNFVVTALEPILLPAYLKDKKDVQVIKQTYENFLEKNKHQFDIVVFLDVLEHLSDPVYILNKTKSILNKNGVLVIQVPNYNSLMATLCKDWSWWMLEDHRFHYSQKSLIKLLTASKYNIEYFTSYEEFDDFKKNLDGNFSNLKPALLRKGVKFLFFLLFIPLYLLFRRFVWKRGYGGLLFVIAKSG